MLGKTTNRPRVEDAGQGFVWKRIGRVLMVLGGVARTGVLPEKLEGLTLSRGDVMGFPNSLSGK